MIRGNYTSFFDIIILGDFMKKIVNEYVFDYSMLQKFYRINLQTKSYLVLLLLVLISTISSFLENDISFGVFSLFIFVLGCLYSFLLPLLLAKTAYKRFLAQVGDKDIHVKVSVDSKNIIIEYKGIKKREVYSLDSVKKIRYVKDAFCLYTKDKVAILFVNDGFVEGDKELLHSFLGNVKK